VNLALRVHIGLCALDQDAAKSSPVRIGGERTGATAGSIGSRQPFHDSFGYLLADATLLGLATATAVLRIS